MFRGSSIGFCGFEWAVMRRQSEGNGNGMGVYTTLTAWRGTV